MKRYQFTVYLLGLGETPGEAWTNALADLVSAHAKAPLLEAYLPAFKVV